MIETTSVHETRLAIARARGDGKRIGLVPTMGYLHKGHTSLIGIARERSDFVVVSVFVNPTQFGPGEDLERYPRDMDRDRRILLEEGANLLFAPGTEEMYGGEPSVSVDPGEIANLYCGKTRPGHFRGVATVVAKLFNIVQPDLAVFGQKDAQQFEVIRRMVRDLNFQVELVAAPIVRESDGLALSSRNTYLSPEERRDAQSLYLALRGCQTAFRDGVADAGELKRLVKKIMRPNLEIDYIAIVDWESFEPAASAGRGDYVLVAAYAGATRLIDNTRLGVDKLEDPVERR
jgi:pantoate--beta-alanine ligase